MANDPVTGRHKPDGPIHHWDGWNGAIDDALQKTGWDAGNHPEVRVELFASVDVVNPGSIVEYIVKLTPGN